MTINTQNQHFHINQHTYQNTKNEQPKAGGKPIEKLLNISAHDLPTKKTLDARKVTHNKTEKSILEAIRVIEYTGKVSRAASVEDLHHLQKEIMAVTSKKNQALLLRFIEEKLSQLKVG